METITCADDLTAKLTASRVSLEDIAPYFAVTPQALSKRIREASG